MGGFRRTLGKLLHLSPTARVQVLSDLHLEFGYQYLSYTFPAAAPLLLLGGDIRRLADYDGYLKFIQTQVCRYRKVFLVLGNHEFYGLDYETGLKMARRLEAEPTIANNFILLHRARWDDPESNLTILGCTLWSKIPEEACSVVQHKVKDFGRISDWTIARHNTTHIQEAVWLREQVMRMPSYGKDKRQFLMTTHHAPLVEGTSQPAHTLNPWTCAFATNLVDQGDWDRVKVWVFGHTHYSTDFMFSGTRLVANQRGYALPFSTPENTNTEQRDTHTFNAAMVIAVGQ